MSTPESSWEASACAQASGVAGSRVVPTTTIGGAPAASMVSGSGCTPRAGGQSPAGDQPPGERPSERR